MTTTKLQQDINDLCSKHVLGILDDISKTYNLDLNELKTKYIDDQSSTVQTDSTTVVPEKKKRGRKKKQKDEFIETVEVEYEGVKYLVDDNNNVYSHNVEEPALIGERLVDGTIKMFTVN